MKKYLHIKILILTILFVSVLGCSKKRKGFTHRAYHNTVSHYNGYFNAREIFKINKQNIFNQHKDDYSEILPLFIYPNEEQSKAMYPEMDKVIEKTSTVIDRHSMYIKKKEYNKWIDKSYMLMGKARFYKQEYFVGEEVFEYMVKAFKTEDVKFEALTWLARTHIQMGNLNKAESYLKLIEDKGCPKQYASDYNALQADFYIKKNNYDDAITSLTKALKTTKGRKDKRRFNYVLAQLWLKKKEYTQASELFSEVIKLKPKYDMMFNAKISRALSFDPASGEEKDIKKMLSRMVKDGKNKEFLDQIHYALADIAFKEKNEPLGIEHLQKSAALSVSNNKQKALSYLRLGELFYSKPKYVQSKAYYDSCLTVLPEDYARYESIYDRSAALTRLVDNIFIINDEDSLQRLANDENFRNKIIDGMVNKAIEEEEQKIADLANGDDLNSFNNESTTASSLPSSGDWYFYNNTTLGFGFTDFKKNWGTRKLEDNWRRSNKETTASFDDEPTEDGDSTTTDSVKINEKTTPEYYLQFIPLNDKDMNISHNKVIEALYALGNIYREDFQDYKNSTQSFEDLITKYDTCRYVLPSWYNLYRISLLTDNDPMKQKYKNLILNNYPESEYARIIQDPSYNKVTRENRKRVDNYYSIVYEMYANRKYSKVLVRCKKAKSIFADNHLQDHFDFLAAMSTGHTAPIDSFKTALNYVIATHPESEVSVEAKRILELIKKGIKIESEQPVSKVPYNHVFEDEFSLILLLPGEDKKANKHKIDISNFNSEYYAEKSYKVSNILIDPENQLIIIKPINGYNDAIDYYKSFKLNDTHIKNLHEKGYRYFLISKDNFTLFYKNKDIDGYLQFFEKNFDTEI
ncbi:MAG: tetratricopeptide repeat protein [Vicingaceae bacterium]